MVKENDIQERAFQFACRIVKLHQTLGKRNSSARPLLSQVLRAGTGVGANLQEAEAGQTKPDFIAKCRISLKEARETLYWLRLLSETEIVSILTTIVKNASISPTR